MPKTLTNREREILVKRERDYRAAKLQRDHDLELLLNANVPLEEALALCPNPMPA